MNYTEKRPWGTFENLLEEKFCKVKKITIAPGQTPSYQYHFKRSEVWVVVQGNGEFKQDDILRNVKYGDILIVPTKSKHQLNNTVEKDLIFIEIQHGEYFGEDDIVRVEDHYGRI